MLPSFLSTKSIEADTMKYILAMVVSIVFYL